MSTAARMRKEKEEKEKRERKEKRRAEAKKKREEREIRLKFFDFVGMKFLTTQCINQLEWLATSLDIEPPLRPMFKRLLAINEEAKKQLADERMVMDISDEDEVVEGPVVAVDTRVKERDAQRRLAFSINDPAPQESAQVSRDAPDPNTIQAKSSEPTTIRYASFSVPGVFSKDAVFCSNDPSSWRDEPVYMPPPRGPGSLSREEGRRLAFSLDEIPSASKRRVVMATPSPSEPVPPPSKDNGDHQDGADRQSDAPETPTPPSEISPSSSNDEKRRRENSWIESPSSCQTQTLPLSSFDERRKFTGESHPLLNGSSSHHLPESDEQGQPSTTADDEERDSVETGQISPSTAASSQEGVEKEGEDEFLDEEHALVENDNIAEEDEEDDDIIILETPLSKKRKEDVNHEQPCPSNASSILRPIPSPHTIPPPPSRVFPHQEPQSPCHPQSIQIPPLLPAQVQVQITLKMGRLVNSCRNFPLSGQCGFNSWTIMPYQTDLQHGPICPLCTFSHRAEDCKVYPTAAVRLLRQKQLQLCHLCLGKHGSTCSIKEFERLCKVPGCGRHCSHAALCPVRFPESLDDREGRRRSDPYY
ncbi:hypothetical protein PRIPAC_98012 [Pristionchus pacificus]|uniref:VPS37 C-terminal domain-containing protein n=1 Tax=Pristionchus pacificus TaxID=54126 RepID=A0A2A6BCQ2_PRIPA|nr:hypothetical protein PRIPAC_98012 [Pristionchus pacificus]|eukprot:PDM63611.1 hypothetical protein PRIPAC_49584 [Pristionchus pacificus]